MPLVTFKIIQSDVTNALTDMVEKANLAPAYLSRVVYNSYLRAQKKRWSVDNNDVDFEGGTWPELKNKYDIEYKAKKYASFPGAGKKLMVRTGTLYNSIVDKSDRNHEMIIFGNTMTINTLVGYAKYLDEGSDHMEARPISKFSDTWKQEILDDWTEYVSKANKSDFDSFIRGLT